MKTPRSIGPFARQLADAVILTDPEGRVEWVNPAFTKLCGYTLAEVRGKKPGDILQGPDSDPSAVEALGEAIRERRPTLVELVNYHKNGTPYSVSISLSPLFDRSGQLTGFMAVEHETSAMRRELRRLENQVAELYGILCNVTNQRPA